MGVINADVNGKLHKIIYCSYAPTDNLTDLNNLKVIPIQNYCILIASVGQFGLIKTVILI